MNCKLFPTDEVDDKLMKLAKETGITILTTDYNLQQVARIQHIPCINVFGLVKSLLLTQDRLSVNGLK